MPAAQWCWEVCIQLCARSARALVTWRRPAAPGYAALAMGD